MTDTKSLFSIFTNSPSKGNRNKDDDIFIIEQTPPDGFILRDRKFGGCAHYSLKAVIEGRNRKTKPIEKYSSDWWSRTTYFMTPRGILKVLKKYKLKFSVLNVKNMNDDEKLMLLKRNLKNGPIILLVANGQTKKKRFSWQKAIIHWHYITLWGYNNKKKIFYVYDSNTKRNTKQYPIKGTLEIPYKYIMKEWGIGASKIIHDYAIAVKY